MAKKRKRDEEGFFNRVREIREERGISQHELARLAGVSQPFLSLLENGKTGGSLDTWKMLAVSLGTTIDDLL
tara:strand:+ start:3099 stop:3314 length:216 start_codon:yes stop_codon:yes gene_type:complete